MPHVTTTTRRIKLAAVALAAAAGLVVAPLAAESAQADASLQSLNVIWDLYGYQYAGGVAFFSQNNYLDALAQSGAQANATCVFPLCNFVAPTLPGSPVTFVDYVVKVTGTDPLVAATALEAKASAALLNPLYNWGSVGTYTKGASTWADFILAQYTSPPPDESSVAPVTISGNAFVGSILHITDEVPGYVTSTVYKWRDNGIVIPGATDSTYTVASTDLGKSVSVSITTTADGLNTGTDTSNSIGPIKVGLIFHPPILELQGLYNVGSTITVDTSAIVGPRLLFSYQWYRDGRAIRLDANSASYSLMRSDRGQHVNVKVTVTSAVPGYRPLTMITHDPHRVGAALPPTGGDVIS
jgi:hypothetical protein